MVPEWARKLLGGHKDEYLEKCVENAAWLAEIENTRGYKLIVGRLEQEALWADRELKNCTIFNFERLQAYSGALAVVLGFIKSTTAQAQAAVQLLSERSEAKRPKSIDEYHKSVFGRTA